MAVFDNNWFLPNKAARNIFKSIESLPVYDIHTHIDLRLVLENQNAMNPWSGLCEGDHYVTSIIESLGAMNRETMYSPRTDPYDKWIAYAKIFPALLGVQIHDWMRMTLKELGIKYSLNEKNARAIWNQLTETLDQERWRPVSIFRDSSIRLMSTTDNPVDSLDQIVKAEAIFGKKYWIPTWRPDPFFNLLPHALAKKRWIDWVLELEKVTKKNAVGNFKKFLSCLEERHDFFATKGCRASDYGVQTPYGHDVTFRRAEAVFLKACQKKSISMEDAADFQSFMMRFSLGLDFEKGWTSQIHYGAVRNMRDVAALNGGMDSGCDTTGGYGAIAESLRPLLNHFDNSGSNHHRILIYSLDKKDWMRIAGLSRIFPSVYSGMAWWFFDSVSGMLEFFRTVPDAGAGFKKIGPFVTDARNIYSLKPRTQLFRRCLSVVISELIEHRGNRMSEGIDLAIDYCTTHATRFVTDNR